MTPRAIRTTADLVSAQIVPEHLRATINEISDQYVIAITPAMAELISPGVANDPIALQFVPDVRELIKTKVESVDPIGDHKHAPVEGIVHRYRDRVLLKIVHTCPVYCRFCFRREMVGPNREPNLSPDAIESAVHYIEQHHEIAEVILTGGDPFILAIHRVANITKRLAAISHVKTIRWHTRVPVVDPDKITPDFVAALLSQDAVTVVAIHANHPREFTPAARNAIALLADAGISLLSQTVLLKDINDSVETLSELLQLFIRARIKPYYLHHADLAPGTSHFRTTIAQGRLLMLQLRQRMQHMALPTYVLDIPGGFSKADLESDAAQQLPSGAWRIRDDQDRWHNYAGE